MAAHDAVNDDDSIDTNLMTIIEVTLLFFTNCVPFLENVRFVNSNVERFRVEIKEIRKRDKTIDYGLMT